MKNARQLCPQNHKGDPRKRTIDFKATDDLETNRAKAKDKPLLNLRFTMGVGPSSIQTTNVLTATALIYTLGAGITEGAGTRLFLQLLI